MTTSAGGVPAAAALSLAARHLIAIAALPFTVTVVVPVWVARRYHVDAALPRTAADAALAAIGVALLAAGGWLFCWSVYYFWRHGRGTLAPWDPPRVFVADGPYRFVRNPMISGVIFVVFGEAAVLRSRPHAAWALLVLAINIVYIPLLEEPMLIARFGAPYAMYCRHVRRFLPRLTPWTPDAAE